MDICWSIYNLTTITPNMCNYESYKDWGLICPYCKKEVYLTKEFKRKGKKVKSHFRHFQKTEETEECRLRVNSKGGNKLIELGVKELRNQRKELFREYLWEIFSYTRNDYDFEEEIKKVDSIYWEFKDKKLINELPNKIKKFIKENLKTNSIVRNISIEEEVKILTQKGLNSSLGTILIVFEDKERFKGHNLKYWESKFSLLRNDFDTNFHLEVSKEVFLYLLECNDKKLWDKLVKVSIMKNSFPDHSKRDILDYKKLSFSFAALIGLTDWSYNMRYLILNDLLNKKKKTKLFNKKNKGFG